MNEQDQERVLDRLANQLRVDEIPPDVRQELEEHYDDLLKYAAIGEEEDFKILYDQASSLMRVHRGRGGYKSPPGRRSYEEKVPAQLSAYEVERSEVFSEYVAKLSADTTCVRRFRSQILEDRLLTPKQARDLLRSPFAAHHPRQWFDVYQVPLVGHSYRVKERGQDEKGTYYSLVEVFSQSKGKHTLKDRRALETGSSWEVVDRKHRAREFDNATREINGYKVMPFLGEDKETHHILVKPYSVLGYLYKNVQQLLRNYPWFEEDAVWFMLTGETPYVAPMTWRSKFRGHNTFGPYPAAGFHYGLITLTIEPWVSANTVERVYRDIQQELFQVGDRKGDNRSIGQKNRELFSFVTERIGCIPLQPQEKRRIGKELVAEWDQKCSQDEKRKEWLYREDTRTIWRDYNLARKLITSPDYKPLAAEGQ